MEAYGRGQKSRGRRNYQRGRVGNLGFSRGARGASVEDSALARLADSQTLRAITLSITTRGIGLGVCHLSFIGSSEPRDKICIPNIHALYRVFLGMLESKLEMIKKDARVLPRLFDHVYRYRVNADMIHIVKTIAIVPEPIRKIINAIRYLTFEDKVYAPAVARNLEDINGAYVPRPENILLSNLRDTVVALSQDDTPAVVRERFHANNPIPGAIWEGHKLVNPDDIIPVDYMNNILDGFVEDLQSVRLYLSSLHRHLPEIFGGMVDFTSKGKPSILISNEMENLKVPDLTAGENIADYCKRCLPVGNVRNYHAICRISPADRIEGQYNLLGEYPSPVTQHYPLYHMRYEEAAAFDMQSNYVGVCPLICYNKNR